MMVSTIIISVKIKYLFRISKKEKKKREGEMKALDIYINYENIPAMKLKDRKSM